MKFLIISILIAASTAASNAAVLAQYNFSTGAHALSSDTDANSTAGDFNISGGSYPTDNSTAGFSTNQHVIFRGPALTTSTATAVDAGDYVSFTLTPNSTTLDLTSLAVRLGGSSDNNGAFTVTAQLRMSLDGYASNVGSSISHLVTSTSTGGNPSYGDLSINLESLADISTPVEFRLYLSTTATGNTANILRMDDVILNGSVIPEPTSAGLMALSAFALIARRKRH